MDVLSVERSTAILTRSEPTGLKLCAWYWGLQILSVCSIFIGIGVIAGAVALVSVDCIYCGYLLSVYAVRQRKLRGTGSPSISNHFGAATMVAVLFLVWSGLSLQWTPARVSCWAMYLTYIMRVLISYILCRLYPIGYVFRSAMKGTAYAVAAFMPLMIVLTGYRGGSRLGGFFFSSISANACYGILAVVYLRRNRDISKSIAMLLMITMLATLFLAFGKTEIIALAVAGVVYVLLVPGYWRQKFTRIALMALAIVLALFFLSSKINEYTSKSGGSTAETLSGRTILWAEAYQQIASGPFVRGFGMMSFREIGPRTWSKTDEIGHAHDEFLTVWFNYGLVGVALVFGSYFALGYAALKSLKRGGGVVATLVLCAIVWSLVMGITEASSQFCVLPVPWLLLFDCVVSTHLAEVAEDARRLRSYEYM
jgi:O-antigen ligase